MPTGNRNRVIARAIVDGGLSAADAATRFGISRQWATTLANRYRNGGDDALEPRSRRPRRSPHATTEQTRARILTLRAELDATGLDHGAESIRDRLHRAGNGADTLVTTRGTGELLAEHTIDPAKDYQPQKRQKPLPKERLHVNDDPRHP